MLNPLYTQVFFTKFLFHLIDRIAPSERVRDMLTGWKGLEAHTHASNACYNCVQELFSSVVVSVFLLPWEKLENTPTKQMIYRCIFPFIKAVVVLLRYFNAKAFPVCQVTCTKSKSCSVVVVVHSMVEDGRSYDELPMKNPDKVFFSYLLWKLFYH